MPGAEKPRMSLVLWWPGVAGIPVSSLVNVLVSVIPRKESVSVPLAKNVSGPAEPGAIVQLVTSIEP
jgi:hypothetical protein